MSPTMYYVKTVWQEKEQVEVRNHCDPNYSRIISMTALGHAAGRFESNDCSDPVSTIYMGLWREMQSTLRKRGLRAVCGVTAVEVRKLDAEKTRG